MLICLDSGIHLAIESQKSFDMSSHLHAHFIFSKHAPGYLSQQEVDGKWDCISYLQKPN